MSDASKETNFPPTEAEIQADMAELRRRGYGAPPSNHRSLQQEVQDLRNHVFNGVDLIEHLLRDPTDNAKTWAREWYAAEIARATVETTVPISTYESAVKGRQDFRKAYIGARKLLKKFIDAWESVPGHENMDRLCEIARNGPMPQEEPAASTAPSPEVLRLRDLLRRSGLAIAFEAGPGRDKFVTDLYQDMHAYTSGVVAADKASGEIKPK